MNTNPKRTRGRPKKEEVDKVRGIYWFRVVSAKSNKSAYALEKEFSKEQFKLIDGVVIRPCLWDKYAKGKKLPSNQLVKKVEEVYPGTARILSLDVWSLFRIQFPDSDKLKAIVSNIKPTLVKHIGKYPEFGARYPLYKKSSIAPLGKIKPLHLVDKSSQPLDQFKGLLAILIDGINKQDIEQCRLCLFELIRIIRLIAYHYFYYVQEEFINLFEIRFLPESNIVLPRRGISIQEIALHNFLKNIRALTPSAT